MLKNIGLWILLAGAIVNFGSDKMFKKGKIKDMNDLLKVKLSGLAVTIVGLIVMIYMYN